MAELSLSQAMLLALLIGILVGGGVRLLLRDHSRLGLAASVLAGIFGSALGAGLLEFGLQAYDLNRTPIPTLIAAVTGTVAVVLIASRFHPVPDPTAPELIQDGESAGVEFKSSARYNKHTNQRDPRLEMMISKTVAAFANAAGGNLLIGVDDAGRTLGLDDDYQFMKHPDTDRFELWLRDHLTRTIGVAATAAIKVEFPVVTGKEICLVRVPRSHRAVFLEPGKGKPVEFWVRIGNSTRELPVDEALAYASKRFGRRGLRPTA